MTKEFQDSRKHPAGELDTSGNKELESFAGEIVDLKVGDRIEFEEDGLKYTGKIKEVNTASEKPKVFEFVVLLDVPVEKSPGSVTLTKTILSPSVTKRYPKNNL